MRVESIKERINLRLSFNAFYGNYLVHASINW